MPQERAYTTEDINEAVRKHLSPGKPVKIGGLDGHHGVLVGLSGEGRVKVSGDAGSHLAAFLDGPEVTHTGSTGDFPGSTMVSGRLVIEGTVGRGLCCHMIGGRARVKGRVGEAAGTMMTGGLLVVDAPVGPGPGEGMTGGTLVLLRPNHLPKRPPGPLAHLIAPRGTAEGVEGYSELEMDHDEVEGLAEALGDLGVASAEQVAALLVLLVAEGTERPPPTPGRTTTTIEGVVLEVGEDGPEAPEEEGGPSRGGRSASTRFESFTKELKRTGGK